LIQALLLLLFNIHDHFLQKAAPNMNLEHLHYFRILARHEHYAKAAEELNITQPSLSYAIASIEKELDVRLFVKQGRGILLSPYGHLFLKYVDKVLTEFQSGKRALLEMKNSKQNNINLVFLPSLSSNAIPSFINQFQQNLEETHIDIKPVFQMSSADTIGIFHRLRSGISDFGFCFETQQNVDDLMLIPILRRDLVVITPHHHPLIAKDSLSLYDLEEYPILSFPSESPLSDFIDDLITKAGISPNYAHGMEDETGVAGLVSNNLGISIVPYTPLLENFEIVIKPLICQPYQLRICFAYKKEQVFSPPATRFLEFIVSRSI